MATSNTQDSKSDLPEEDSITPDYKTCLGVGSFGVVYKGTYGGQEVAVKVINKHMLINKGKYKNIDKNEIIPFLRGLCHPNVISILALEDHDYELWLAMEHCDTSLDKYLKDNDPDLSLTFDILHQGATGLAYLHDNNIIHRDLRPDNELILIKDSHPIIKITDFSLCKDITDQPTSSMTTVWGNRNWIAPELLSEDGGKTEDVIRYKKSIDVFAYALVILYVCVNADGRKMINSIHVCCGAMIKRGEDVLGKFDGYWRSTGLKEKFLPLLKKMLALDPEARPTMSEVFFPPIVPTPPQLHHLASHSLQYDAHLNVGIGGDGLILLGRYDPASPKLLDRLLHRHNPERLQLLQLRNGEFHQVWEKPCPPGVRWEDGKYIVGDSITTHHSYSDPTLCWDLRMQPLHEHEAGRRLDLVSCLAPHVMVYRERIERDSHQLVLRGCEMLPLRPPAGSRWREYLSVCQHAGTSWYAVCDYGTDSLDIFDAAGHHQRHVSLPYTPDLSDAICCTKSHLIVCEWLTGVLHIHTWSGQEVGTVDLGQVCGLNMWKYVNRMAVCDGGRTLIVAVGAGGVRSLHAITISD